MAPPSCFTRPEHLISAVPGTWSRSSTHEAPQQWRHASPTSWDDVLPRLALPAYIADNARRYSCSTSRSTSHVFRSTNASCALQPLLREGLREPLRERYRRLAGLRLTLLGDSTMGQLYVSLGVLTHGLNITLKYWHIPYVPNYSVILSWLRSHGARRSDADVVIVNVGSWYNLNCFSAARRHQPSGTPCPVWDASWVATGVPGAELTTDVSAYGEFRRVSGTNTPAYYASDVTRLARIFNSSRELGLAPFIWRETLAQHHRGGLFEPGVPCCECYEHPKAGTAAERAAPNWRNAMATPILAHHAVPIMPQYAYSAGAFFMHGDDCTHYCTNSQLTSLVADVTMQWLALWLELRPKSINKPRTLGTTSVHLRDDWRGSHRQRLSRMR